jgi:signal transduction histidine kinase
VAGRWSEESGVAASVTVDGETRELPAAYEVALLRTAQESLANIRKHAGATQVTLTLTYLADQVSLDVADNGRGFDPGQAANPGAPEDTGYGLLGLRERVSALGGSLSLETAPGEGVTLAVALPYKNARAEA